MGTHFAIARASGFAEEDRQLIETVARECGLLYDDRGDSEPGMFTIRFMPAFTREAAREAVRRLASDDIVCCAVDPAEAGALEELMQRPEISLVPHPFERAALFRWFEGFLRRLGFCREARQALYGSERFEAACEWRTDALHVSGAARFGASVMAMSAGLGEREMEEVFLALEEGLINAVEHGNLGLDSALKPDSFLDEDAYEALRRERLADEVFASRRVRMRISCVEGAAEVRITDEGEGFDPTVAETASGVMAAGGAVDRGPGETLAGALGKSGMGFALMRRAFDAVRYDPKRRELGLSRARRRED